MSLSRFRVEDVEPQVEVESEHLRPFEPTFVGRLMAVDPSLSKSGVAIIDISSAGRVNVNFTAMVRSTSGRNVDRIDQLIPQFLAIIKNWRPSLLVHESPPAAVQGRISRPDAALASGVCVRTIWQVACPGLPVMDVSAQTAKLRWTGERAAEKRDVGAAILGRWSHISDVKPNNEDTRDAIALGLVGAERYSRA